jgi:hypothetical protein
MKHKNYTLLALLAFTLIFSSCKDDESAPPIVEPGVVESPVPELYLSGAKNTPTLTPMHDLSSASIRKPRDLEFHPDKNQLWVMNKGANGSDFVIIDNPGEGSENIKKRKDSHSGHFAVNGSAMAFSNINTFATAPEIKNTTQNQNSTFMGPALWSSELDVFANIYQSNWAAGQPLGSHLDMLHQSPFSMGIAHDKGNGFWVFDGFFENLVYYDFVDDHGPGAEYHADGIVYRHSDVKLQRVADVPSHMVVNKKNGAIYICDTYNGQVLKVNPKTATFARNLQAPNEQLTEYKEYTGSDVIIVGDNLNKPCGIDIRGNRLFVSDYETGIIHVYNTDTNEELDTYDTGVKGNTGIEISAKGEIWLVNYLENKLSKIVRN